MSQKNAKMWRRSRLAGGGHDGRLRAADTGFDLCHKYILYLYLYLGACSESGYARIPWKYITHMEPAEGKADSRPLSGRISKNRENTL